MPVWMIGCLTQQFQSACANALCQGLDQCRLFGKDTQGLAGEGRSTGAERTVGRLRRMDDRQAPCRPMQREADPPGILADDPAGCGVKIGIRSVAFRLRCNPPPQPQEFRKTSILRVREEDSTHLLGVGVIDNCPVGLHGPGPHRHTGNQIVHARADQNPGLKDNAHRSAICSVRTDNGMFQIDRRHSLHRLKHAAHHRFAGAHEGLDLFLIADVAPLEGTIGRRLHL